MAFNPIPGKPNWEYDDNPPDPGGNNTALWSTGTNGIRTSTTGQEIYQNTRLVGSNSPSRPSEISKTFWDYQYSKTFSRAYLQPSGGVLYLYRRPDGTSLYKRPAS